MRPGLVVADNAITGLVEVESGSIKFEGAELMGLKPHQVLEHGVVRTFQNIRLFPNLTVLENVRLAAQARAARPVYRPRVVWEPRMRRCAQRARQRPLPRPSSKRQVSRSASLTLRPT